MLDKIKKNLTKIFKGKSVVKKYKKYDIKKYILKSKKYNENKIPRILQKVITEFKYFQRTLRNHNEYDIRSPIIPEFITENLVMLAIKKYLGDPTVTRKCSGDLVSELLGLIEVKAFSSNGPNSFSTCMKWDSLFFCDCRVFDQDEIFIYKVENTLEEFKKLMVTKDKNFQDCEDIGMRAKISFDSLKEQKNFKYKKIYQGSYKKLLV